MKTRLAISTLIILGTVAGVFGQGFADSRGGADQTLRGSGRVNPSTLGMEIQIPLGSYPGRGINVPISISYSSKVWQMKWLGSIDGGIVSGGCRSLSRAEYSETSASGWTTSLAVPYIEYTGKDNLYDSHGFPLDMGLCVNASPPQDNLAAYVRRISVHLPSGETHELRADDSPVTYDRSSSCPPYNGYGCDPNSYWLQYNWDRTFYAVDGSNLKYVEGSNTNTYRLQMPDGSYYDFENSISGFYGTTARKANKFTDRNGNFTSYNSQTGAWTDTLGRTLTAPIGMSAPVSPTTQTYSMPGMTGTYKFTWKQLKGSSAAESGLTDFSQALRYRGDADHQISNGNWAWKSPSLFHSVFGSPASFVLAGSDLFNPIVLTEIELLTGQKYKFSYDVFGQIEHISYPTGGEEHFIYSFISPLTPSETETIASNLGVTNRKVYKNSGDPTPYEWTYTAGYSGGGYVATVNNPDGTKAQRFLYEGNSSGGEVEGSYGYDNGLAGMAYEERGFDSANRLISRTLRTWTKKTFTDWPTTADWHPRVTQEDSTTYDSSGNGVSTTVKYEYEGDLNLRETPVLVNKTTQYAFQAITGGQSFNMSPPPCDPSDPNCMPSPPPTPTPLPTPSASPVKIVETTYLIHDPNYSGVAGYYTAQNMVGLATVSKVKDGSGNIVSQSETVYDESDRSPAYRGNPTTAKVWDSTKGVVTNTSAFIGTHARFDSYGNQYEATDALGNTSITTFDSTYHAFPIQATSAVPDPSGQNGSNTAFVTTATFDTTTGLPLTTTDPNGLETRITYDPVTLRPLNTKTYFNNSQVGGIGETIYHDETGNYWTKSRKQIDDTHFAESTTYFDGLGRAYKTEQLNSQGNIFVEKEFDDQGRVKRVTNPYRSGETKQWTTNVYDEASRVKEIDLPDSSKILTDYGVSITGKIGITKQITDQAGKKRKGISDALGNMIRVIEDPTGQNLSTDYVFDTLGNLRKTTQGEQNRFFLHDSLGRLLYAKQVEQDTNSNFVTTDPITGNTAWSVKYVYDDNGNITSTTDARNKSVSATYDHLNRLTVRDYSDTAMPDVSFYYDGKYLDATDTVQMATGSVKGKTTGTTSSVSKTNFTGFDVFGRALSHQQITDGQTYSTGYTYNLSGALIEETYPSGRVVKNTIDENGELEQVQSRKNSNYGYWQYAGSFSRDTSGNVTKMQLGNGRWETASYNNRSEVTQIGLGATDSSQNLLKLEYKYDTTTTSHDNNGSLLEQKITVPTVGGTSGFTATQTYLYDSLNRLQSAEEKVGGSTTWKQTFSIDRYGNRRFDTSSNGLTTTLGSCTTAVCNPSINTSDNKFTSGQGYAYDQNGNLTQDATGQRFGYDSESHQKEFFAANNSGTMPDATYSYDGNGKRIKKVTATETTIFVYDGGGQLVAEYSTQISQTPQVSYLTTDHLGSPRVITDQNGAITSRKDYSAFGEETTSSQRVNGLGYAATTDQLRQDYTGYEKDSESGLDFAQARYYNSAHGRYTSVDPMIASATIKNPQTFNRYSYVLNSPYKFSDPLGLLPESHSSPPSYGCSAEFASCGDDGWGTWNDGPTQDSNTSQAETPATHETEQAPADSQQQPDPPPPPPNVKVDVIEKTATITVDGADATEALENARKANGGFLGEVAWETSINGAPNVDYTYTEKNGTYTVTATIKDINISLTGTTTLPEWKGYSSASPEQQKIWDSTIASTRNHEEGHTEILHAEAAKIEKAIKDVLPTSSQATFVTKSGDKNAMLSQARKLLNAPQITTAIQTGFANHNSRQENYDKVTGHILSPKQLKEKGIEY